MDMMTHILALAVALLAALCFWQSYVIERRNETLVRYTDEIMKLKDAIMDMELEIQRSNEVIRALRDRQDDDSNDSGKDSPKGPTTEAVAEDRRQ